MKTYTVRKSCRICGSHDLRPFADLGNTPLADKFTSKHEPEMSRYPLVVKVCAKCFLVQMTTEVDKRLLYGHDYAFFTSSSPSSIEYFKAYASEIPAESSVVEIASNDGLLLSFLKEKDCRVLGIDPAVGPTKLAASNGIQTLREHFSYRVAKRAKKIIKSPDYILANNVLAHVDDLHDFVKGVRHLMDENTTFVFECQYLPQLLFNCQYDNIYHEHRSFFSLFPLVNLFDRYGMNIFKVEQKPTQGGSIRCYVGIHKPITESVVEVMRNEILMQLNEIQTYGGFQARANFMANQLHDLVSKLVEEGKTVAGYGASAKSCTMIHMAQLEGLISYIADRTPYKFNKYAPGTSIKVRNQNCIKKKPDCYVLFVWNYLEGVLKREQGTFNGSMIVPNISLPVIFQTK